jgi:DNA-binding response OmpR family regulator
MAPASETRKRILYVDNHEDNREMLAILLGYAGYEVATAATAIEGMNSLTRLERFDLLILESVYPDARGVDLCRQIRALDSNTPILFFSSAAYPKDIAAGMAAGAQHYLIKPDGLAIIEQTIAGLLAGTTEACAYAQ